MTNTLDPRPDLEDGPRRLRDGDGRTIWIVLGLVAVVAIIALAFVLTRNSDAAHQAQLDQAVAQQHALDASTAGAASTNTDAAARAPPSAPAGDFRNAVADEAPPASQPATSDSTSTAPSQQ